MVSAALSATGCFVDASAGDVDTSTTAGPGGNGVAYLEQGWDAATRAAFYQTTQGSRLLPYKWFLHLEQADKKDPLRDPKNLAIMGFVSEAEAAASNPDHLPIGLTRDVDVVRGDALGLTCATCHTGQLEYGGRVIRIDGGQSMADLEQLQRAIHGSLAATLADSKKLDRFAGKILDAGAGAAAREALVAEMTTLRDWWAARIERSRGLSPHGPSRTDAFTIIGNEIVCEMFQDPRNCTPAVAPTQFPHLWDTPDFEWVQYNSSVHSPLGRNVGQATGVFAENQLDLTNPYGLIVESSANIENLSALEEMLKTLRSPAWPEELLGEIDVTLAAQGAELYASECASCHTLDPQPRTAPNAFGLTFAKVDFSTPLFPGPNGEVPPQGLLGTDPTAAVSFAMRTAFPGPFEPIVRAKGLINAEGKAPAAALLNISGSLIIQRFFAENGLDTMQKLAYLGFRESLTPSSAQLVTYKARPLNGVVFTAPYLHNGSVPSLYELLLPPDQRTKQFYVGSHKFDPVKVGFSTEKKAESVLLDTTLVGNGNGGHYWGTQLSDGQRMAVIEYLKTL